MRRLGQIVALILLLVALILPQLLKHAEDNPATARIALPMLWHLRVAMMSLTGHCLQPNLCYQEDATDVEAHLVLDALAAHGRRPGPGLDVKLRREGATLQMLIAVPEGAWLQGDLIRDVTLAAKDLRPKLFNAPDVFLTGSDWLPRRFIPSECTTRGAGCMALSIPEGAPFVPREQVTELPRAEGGRLADGTYLLTSFNYQGLAMSGGPARGALRIAGDVMESATIFDSDRTQYLDCLPNREVYKIRVNRTQLIAVQTCPSECPGGCETHFGFTASGNTLTLITPGDLGGTTAMKFTSH